MAYDNQNIFAKILRKEIPSFSVYEDDLVYAFLDIMPVNPGHILIAVKEQVALLEDLSPKATAHLMIIAQKLTRTIKSTYNCPGVNLLMNDGPASGQEVPHLHLHLIPRYEGDGFGFRFGSKGRIQSTPEALKLVAESLKTNLK